MKPLKRLKISNFRAFGDVPEIDLDADVVLVFGPNGAGKTSLVSSIEFAIAGEVSALRAYDDDYPRCLRNIYATSPAKVSLTVEGSPLPRTFTSDVSPQNVVHHSGDESLGDLYQRRSLMSQGRLGRFIEDCEKRESEEPQPILQALRTILGLQVIENVKAGLDVAADIRRVRKAIPEYKILEQELENAAVANSEIAATLGKVKSDRFEILGRLQDRLRSFNVPLEPSTVDMNALRRVGEALRSADDGEQRHAEIGKRRSDLIMYKSALERLGESTRDATDILSEHSEAKKTLDLLRADATRLLTDISVKVSALVKRFQAGTQFALDADLSPGWQLPESLEQLTAQVAAISSRLRVRRAQMSELTSERLRIEARLHDVQKSLADLPNAHLILDKSQRRAQLLQLALATAEGSMCPVCERDFSELGSASLHDHIERSLRQLHEVTEAAKATYEARVAYESELRTLTSQANALERQAGESASDRALAAVEAIVAECAAQLDGLRRDAQPIRDLRAKADRELARVGALERRIGAQRASLVELGKIAEDVGITASGDSPITPVELLQATQSAVAQQLIVESKRADEARQKSAELAVARVLLQDAETHEERLQGIRHEQERRAAAARRFKSRKDRADEFVKSSRALLLAVATVEKALLEQVFTARLNGLWLELYERLVPNPGPFRPTVGAAQTSRGRLRAPLQASAGVAFFEQMAAVLSAGNLNTAAVSLFLALHLVEPPTFPVIVLDDPVQSMDDVHIVQLASVLRSIVNQGHRQLVVAVHDRALFEYLVLELGPTAPDRSLVTIEIAPAPKQVTQIEIRKIPYEPDDVRFAETA